MRRPLTGDGASSLLMFTGGDAYDPVLGRTYNEIGGEARSMHKCQGMSQLLPLPGVSARLRPGPRGYRLRDTVLPGGVNRHDRELFDGVDTALASLARFAGAQPPAGADRRPRRASRRRAPTRRAAFDAEGIAAAVAAAGRAGSTAVRALRAELARMRSRRRGALRDRHPAGAEGGAVRARRCCSPPTCGSRRSPTTASSWPGSRCRSTLIAANRGDARR